MPTVEYRFPDGTLLFCVECQRETPHGVDRLDRRYVKCTCGRRILGAQVVSLYADDKYQQPAVIYFPLRLRPVRELVRLAGRAEFWSAKMGLPLGVGGVDDEEVE